MEGGLVFIGPEGDFTPTEIQSLLDAGAVPVRFTSFGRERERGHTDESLTGGTRVVQVGLGPLRLRAETAAIALLSTLMMYGEAEAR
jgi:16S rRNA U1498 N3-methylase RsmE